MFKSNRFYNISFNLFYDHLFSNTCKLLVFCFTFNLAMKTTCVLLYICQTTLSILNREVMVSVTQHYFPYLLKMLAILS